MNNNENLNYFYSYNECNRGRVEELNERIASRNIPSSTLEQNTFRFIPQVTKFSLMPITAEKPITRVPLAKYPTFDPHQTFNPSHNAPFTSYAPKVDIENKLQHREFALQGSDQIEYVPSSNSSLYVNYVPNVNPNNKQTHELLFKQNQYQTSDCNTVTKENTLFLNSTRQSILDIKK